MKGSFSFFEVLLLIGIFQGLLITVLIWLYKKNQLSKRLLSFVLIVFNLLCIKLLIHTTGLWQTTVFRYFPLAVELLIQPLIWLYVCSLIQPGFRWKKQYLLHFIPFAVFFAYALFVYVRVLPVQDLAQKDLVANGLSFNRIKTIEDFLSISSSVIYWGLSFRLLLHYRRWLNDTIADTSYPTYAWMKNIALLMGILIGLLAAAILLDQLIQPGTLRFIHWQFFFIYLAALIYYLGFRGYQLPERKSVALPATIPADENTISNTLAAPPAAGRKNSLPAATIDHAKKALLHALENEKCYLDPELNLQKLALATRTTPAILSTVINQELQKSFRTLVNEYRVEEVKRQLTAQGAKQFSLLGIAYASGFNSEASFYRIFKTLTGISPKEYVRQQPGND